MVSRIALGLPGRFIMSAFPRMPAVWRDRMAVGTCLRLIARICSPKPGIMRLHTASVASGVTSRGAGPVPPVVTTTLHPSSSTSCLRAASITFCSSGITLYSAFHSECTASVRNCRMAGPLRSWYTPELALSLTVTTPNTAGSPTESGVPPTWCGIASEAMVNRARLLLAQSPGSVETAWGRALWSTCLTNCSGITRARQCTAVR
mmetsp:Transcript_8718/g.26125  ORF Transcript_8718/g.26125 Transcript_8718/m.26125 type:complete len:205 (-) Transcript_8718:30-644(-)